MFLRTVVIACVASSFALFGADPDGGVRAKLIVTVADHVNHRPKPLTLDDIADDPTMKVIDIEPLKGQGEVFVLIDEAATYNFGNNLEQLRSFVLTQPASMAVGVAYIKDGNLNVALKPTHDLAAAARAVHAPSGGKGGSPYCALSSLIAAMPSNEERKEIVMVTSGIDYTQSPGVTCSSAEAAISDAQGAGVVVYSIYHPNANYADQPWRTIEDWQVEMAHVAFETGGESYFTGHEPMETITPFLRDIAEHIGNQYLLTISMRDIAGAGFQQVFLMSKSVTLELMMPDKVWACPEADTYVPMPSWQ